MLYIRGQKSSRNNSTYCPSRYLDYKGKQNRKYQQSFASFNLANLDKAIVLEEEAKADKEKKKVAKEKKIAKFPKKIKFDLFI